ncbi:uncharacterized protein LOC121195125 [Toxotes jaculatrix]|uniref:uncharacterized protein LOC121195125 n=1 Tax=Toxotes jaculatrix TaxID=941984 RepID=UPI001B3ADDE0|nr:uncharacterized protein LOC121195125 [Toxotes jaculatrix]
MDIGHFTSQSLFKDKAEGGGGDFMCVCLWKKTGRYSQVSAFFLFPPSFVADSLSEREELQIPFQGPGSLSTHSRTPGRPCNQNLNSTSYILRVPGPHSFPFPSVSFPPSTPFPAMSTPFPLLQPRGIDHSLPTCRETQCSNHGDCVGPSGGGTVLICECDLGYQGEFCEDTVNGALNVPLTLSVLGVIVGLLILAFIVAKLRRKQKKKRRRNIAENTGYNVAL